MKAYVFSIGEKTTEICIDQLERYGFEVVLLDGFESIGNKYKRFIMNAEGSCLKIDADIIPNSNIQYAKIELNTKHVVSFSYFDFYRNDIWVGCPTLYSMEAISDIQENLDILDANRPETSACRLPGIQENRTNSNIIMGMHGFFQSQDDMKRVMLQKLARRQESQFDIDFINKLRKI